jgi:hypothetical protein
MGSVYEKGQSEPFFGESGVQPSENNMLLLPRGQSIKKRQDSEPQYNLLALIFKREL